MKKLQLFLSHNGVCSRRKAMDLIQQGHVKVNGREVMEPSTMIDPDQDRVEVNGRVVGVKDYKYILLNKPPGFVTTMSDPEGSKTVYDLLPPRFHHLKPVGRLDKNTQGLLLLTNDGDLANMLTHPRFNVDKVYIVGVEGKLNLENKKKVERGVLVYGKKTSPAQIRNLMYDDKTNRSEFTMCIHEGRKRQVRLMMKAVGHEVTFLKRIQQGPLKLTALRIGQYRRLSDEELGALQYAPKGASKK